MSAVKEAKKILYVCFPSFSLRMKSDKSLAILIINVGREAGQVIPILTPLSSMDSTTSSLQSLQARSVVSPYYDLRVLQGRKQ